MSFGRDEKVLVIMVGLPARGKSFIAKRVCKMLTWLGYNARILFKLLFHWLNFYGI